VIVWLALATVILFYAVPGLVALAPESVYSGDIGAKVVQARAEFCYGRDDASVATMSRRSIRGR
jgi:hypothetical protein